MDDSIFNTPSTCNSVYVAWLCTWQATGLSSRRDVGWQLLFAYEHALCSRRCDISNDLETTAANEPEPGLSPFNLEQHES